MTVEELANKRYGGEFVFMLGHLEGVTRFVFEWKPYGIDTLIIMNLRSIFTIV